MYTVYMHINQINKKSYIGLTKQNPKHRWGNNGINYKKGCNRFWNAIQKYGWDNFDHAICKSGLTKNDACELEKKLILEYRTQEHDYGYNITEGGEAPRMPLESRNKIANAMMGNKHGLGKVCSEEKKIKISQAQKGRKLTFEHRQKLSQAKKGKHHDSPSLETRQKISASHKKKQVICVETNIVYDSVQECGRQLGIDATTICACCKGRIKSTHSMHFQYYI